MDPVLAMTRVLARGLIIVLVAAATGPVRAQGVCSGTMAGELRIDLVRVGTDNVMDRGQVRERVYGDIGLNGQNIGRFYENPAKRIPEGIYRGLLRYKSDRNFVQSSCGQLSREGDFLLEIGDVRMPDGKMRTNILLHPGALPSHSEGCILMGARQFDTNGMPEPLHPSDPLAKLRRAFYGTDNPISCPSKPIAIVIGGKP